MLDRIEALLTDQPPCTCTPTRDQDQLTVVAEDCPGQGNLTAAPPCRGTVIEAIGDRPVEAVLVRVTGREHRYDGRAATFLNTVATTAETVAARDPHLATRLRHHPIQAGHDATARAGPVGTLTDRTGLAEELADASDLETVLAAAVAPRIADTMVTPRPPEGGTLRSQRSPGPYTDVRIYDDPTTELPTYHLDPPSTRLTSTDCSILARAHEALATGAARGGVDTPTQAIVTTPKEPDAPPEELIHVLEKHTLGYGVLADLFADPTVSDVYAPAPVTTTPLRVDVDGETMRTNTRLTRSGAAAMASRLRRASGHAFSRAQPTIDAEITVGRDDHRVRATGVSDPASDGYGFAFRTQTDPGWTLPRLVANGTLTAWTAALLSTAVERGAAVLIAGARSAGKTTLLGAMLWELPAATRLVTIEDTPELPVQRLREHRRDVQALYTSQDRFDAETALRSALRMGEGALVVGEVRGQEATVLYEAMRVGAQASTVLGTIHGNSARGVRERVITDLDVPASSFATTDLVVTAERTHTGDGSHRIASIEEITGETADDIAPVFAQQDHGGTPTGRIARGSSTLLSELATPTEDYATIRDVIDDRETFITALVADDRTSPAAVVRAHARRRRDA